MTDVLNRRMFLVKEQASLLKAAFTYDILDPETGTVIMECREDQLSPLTRLLRFSKCRRTTPFDIRVRTPDGQAVVRATRGVPKIRSRVVVFDGHSNIIGGFRQRLLSVSPTFDVVDANGEPLCKLQRELLGWKFQFLAPGDIELARVEKKWAGLGKEFCTSADDYMLQIDDAVPRDSTTRQLILASVICIDLVLKVEIP